MSSSIFNISYRNISAIFKRNNNKSIFNTYLNFNTSGVESGYKSDRNIQESRNKRYKKRYKTKETKNTKKVESQSMKKLKI